MGCHVNFSRVVLPEFEKDCLLFWQFIDSFKEFFGNLVDDGDSLQTAPKGFSQDHEHIDLLRRKTFAVQHNLTQKAVMSADFDNQVIKIYKEMLPFRTYLNQAVSV